MPDKTTFEECNFQADPYDRQMYKLEGYEKRIFILENPENTFSDPADHEKRIFNLEKRMFYILCISMITAFLIGAVASAFPKLL